MVVIIRAPSARFSPLAREDAGGIMPMPWKAVARAVKGMAVYDMKGAVYRMRAGARQPACVGLWLDGLAGLLRASTAATRTMWIASNGQRTAHSAHPVQPGASCRVEHLGPQGPVPCTCSDSTCGGHTAMHQPQPVQRWGSMEGRALGAVVVMGCRVVCSVPP